MRHRIEIGRFGRFRDLMVSQANSVAVHTLQELINPRARSILYDRNHGAWEGTDTVRGVMMETIFEGEFGARFLGGGRVRVPNDGVGFRRPDDPGGSRSLSLAGGDGDLYGLLVCNTNDATERCLVHKQDGNSPTGNGYKVSVQNGQIRGFLKVAGSVIFNFARDLPLDLLEHVWQLHISANDNLARFILDGIPLGADVTCSAEPALTDGDYCIAGFANNTGGFIGTLSMIGCSREGDPTICAALNACRTRSPITNDIRVETHPVEAGHGIFDPSPRARTAPPGWMRFALDNSPLNEAGVQGFYTPGHENAMPGWQEGDPIEWAVLEDDGTEHVRFFGMVSNTDPEPGIARNNLVPVECETWLARAMRATVRQLPIRTNIRSDDAIRYLIDAVDRPPRAVELAIGEVTFPFIFDDVSPNTKVYEMLARIVNNEGGLLYEQPDGTLVFESRTQRYFPAFPVAFWDEATLDDIEADRGTQSIANVIPYTITPRRVGTSTTEELVTMPDRVRVLPGETLALELSYRDPDNPSEPVGGTDITVPVAVTDYTATEGEAGDGVTLTAYAAVAAAAEDIGGSSIKLSITNSGDLPFWFKTRVRGRKLQRFDPRTFLDVRDDASVLVNDEQEDPIEFDYLTDQEQARSIAGQELALRRSPYMAPRVAHRIGVDEEMETDIVRRVIGELVSIGEEQTGLDDADRIFIHGVEFGYGAEGVFRADYAVTRGQAAQSFWIVGEVGYSEVGESTVVA